MVIDTFLCQHVDFLLCMHGHSVTRASKLHAGGEERQKQGGIGQSRVGWGGAGRARRETSVPFAHYLRGGPTNNWIALTSFSSSFPEMVEVFAFSSGPSQRRSTRSADAVLLLFVASLKSCLPGFLWRTA